MVMTAGARLLVVLVGGQSQRRGSQDVCLKIIAHAGHFSCLPLDVRLPVVGESPGMLVGVS